MARSESKRQKRLAKQKAKRNQKQQDLKRQKSMGLAAKLAQFESAPIVDCLINEEFEEQGIGGVLIGRKSNSSECVFAVFLVDKYCMGVKDAYAKVLTVGEYRQNVERFSEQGARPLDPPSARRLIEDSVAYAREIGLFPHPDYRKVRPVLNGIDPDQARETFEMGKDGKPYFVAGPHQSQSESRRIIETLHAKCGPGGYHYLVPMADPSELQPGERLIAADEDGNIIEDREG